MHLPFYKCTSCPCWLQVVHLPKAHSFQVWNELREGWEVFWYETWRTFWSQGFRKSFLETVKRKVLEQGRGLMKG